MSKFDGRIPTFRSISKVSNWLVNWTIAIIIITVVNSVTFSVFSVPSSDLQNGNIGFIMFVIGILNLILVIVTGIITLVWFYRSNKNIHAFGAKEVSSPRMAVIWWFIPILNLWKPYQVAQQIWKASDPLMVLSNGTEWKKSSNSDIIKIWWLLAILSIVVSLSLQFFIPSINAQPLFEPRYETNPSIFDEQFQIIVPSILGIVSSIFFIKMIKQISDRQEIKDGRSI